MPRKAFADPDELDAMIRDLAQEKGLPDGICPDLVGPDPDNHGYWGSGNEEDHEQSCIWRGKLLAELRRRPGWRKAWRAEQELNRRIEALCEDRGWRFKPWEAHPVDVGDGPVPPPYGTAWAASWPKAQQLRRKLIAELEAE